MDINVKTTEKNVHYWYIRANWTFLGKPESGLINTDLNTNRWIGCSAVPTVIKSYKSIDAAKKDIGKIVENDKDFDSFDIIPFTDD